MDRIQTLEVFVAVADMESFAGAARTLGLSPPSVTRGINELEERLGARLFTRTTRIVRLTDAGRVYLDEVRHILDDLKAADDAASGAAVRPTGLLRVTAPVEFGRIYIAPIMTEFLDLYPDVTANMLLVDRTVNLADEGIDVGVRIGPLPTSGLIAIRVGEISRVICGAPGYFEKYGRPEKPEHLLDHNIAAIAGVTSNNDWRFGSAQDQVVKVKPRLSVTSVAAGRSIARSGWGLTRVLSYQIGPDLKTGDLETVLQDYEPDPWPIHLVHLEGRRASAKHRAFIDLARDRLRGSSILNRR